MDTPEYPVGSVVGQQPVLELPSAPIVLRHRTKYPGRNRVLHREDAADAVWRQYMREESGKHDRYACTDPYIIYGIGLPSASDAMRRYWQGKTSGRVPVEFPNRCRKCENCLLHRRRLWAARAYDEMLASSRTWFGTLTFNPECRFLTECHASGAAKMAGLGEWRSMEPSNQYKYLADTASVEVTKYLKRVRKNSGVPLRYLLVAEAHKDGFPHFHLLLHEQSGPVRKARLEEWWLSGHSHWRLVDASDRKAAYYVCKYLSKDIRTRVRASVRYGRAHMVGRLTECMQGATRALAGSPRLSSGPPREGFAQ